MRHAVCAGELSEWRYKIAPDTTIIPAPISQSKLSPGITTTLIDRGIAHRIANNGVAKAMSLHLYAPPLEQYQSWDLPHQPASQD